MKQRLNYFCILFLSFRIWSQKLFVCELLFEYLLQLGFLLSKAFLINSLENLSNFREGVAVSGHNFTVIQRIFNLKVSLWKCRRTSGLSQIRSFQFLFLSINRFRSLKSQFVIKDLLSIKKINSLYFLIKLKRVEFENHLKDFDNVAFFLKLTILDKSYKHTDHRISVKSTWNIIIKYLNKWCSDSSLSSNFLLW